MKHIHSCVLVEENDSRILFDPGSYLTNSMIAKIKRQEPQAIFITHKHQDHFVPDILKELVGPETKIYVPSDAMQVVPEDLHTHIAVAGTTIQVGTNTIAVTTKEHGDILSAKPENIAYVINERILHPGDSVLGEEKNVEVLFVPFFSPWGNVKQAVEYAIRSKPKIVIAIHDAFVKDAFLDSYYEGAIKPALEKEGIELKVLGLAESIEV